MYVSIIIVVGGMIYLGAFAPDAWMIDDFTAIVPLSLNLVFHALVPLVLNPSLMVSSSPKSLGDDKISPLTHSSGLQLLDLIQPLSGMTHTLICNQHRLIHTRDERSFTFVIMKIYSSFLSQVFNTYMSRSRSLRVA
jgi:hypothetical protein